MSTTATIVTALKFEGGVIIASDSQASDLYTRVRWDVEKLDQVKVFPLVIGFSGSMGQADRARKALDSADWHQNMFRKVDLVRDAVDRCLAPVYEDIQRRNPQPVAPMWEISLHGLAACWAENQPHIIEFELNHDTSYHQYFHAVGSASGTAYAVWRTLGGRNILRLDDAKAVLVTLRVLRTCVNVEMWGVNEHLSLWVVNQTGARKLSLDEIQAQLQYVDSWEEKDRTTFFGP